MRIKSPWLCWKILINKEGMPTKILDHKRFATKIKEVDDCSIQEAAKFLQQGELVAFPTETVYGLGADGLNAEAVKKIFIAKGRPQDNPLILHIHNLQWLGKLGYVAKDSLFLAEKLWPGPMTMVLYKKDLVPDIVTANGDTVGIRMPSHPVAARLIDAADTPIAAPSANVSGRPSPTNAQDVFDDLNGKIPIVLDGGDSSIGIESTVIDMSQKPYTILRPGYYTKEDFELFVDEVQYDKSILKEGEIPKSPGQKYKHYAPKATTVAYVGTSDEKFQKMNQSAKRKRTGVLCFEENKEKFPAAKEILVMGKSSDVESMAHHLFRYLREMDKRQVDQILVEGLPEKGIGIGVMNRLRKACGGKVKIFES